MIYDIDQAFAMGYKIDAPVVTLSVLNDLVLRHLQARLNQIDNHVNYVRLIQEDLVLHNGCKKYLFNYLRFYWRRHDLQKLFQFILIILVRVGLLHKVYNVIMYLLIELQVFHRRIYIRQFFLKQLLLSIHRLNDSRYLPKYTRLK